MLRPFFYQKKQREKRLRNQSFRKIQKQDNNKINSLEIE